MKFDDRPIGIFDSGLGGLTVASAIMDKLPNEDIVYLGDTARVPYGNKSVENIIKFSENNSSFLISKGVKLIVIACNSASAVAINHLQNKFPETPIIGVIDAGAAACSKHESNKITVIGTRATVGSKAYETTIKSVNKNAEITSIACPLFVPLAEEGVLNCDITANVIDLYLQSLADTREKKLLLLGCTHYPILIEDIQNYVSDSVTIIDSANSCADFTLDFIGSQGINNNPNHRSSIKFFVTDTPSGFIDQACRFLGHHILDIQKISVD